MRFSFDKRSSGSKLGEPFAAEKGSLRAKNRWKLAAIIVVFIAVAVLTLSTPSVQTVYGSAAETQEIESLQIGSIVPFGGYDWRVLDVQNGKALILCETVIEDRVYNNEYKDVTWETCTLRGYLNTEFYNKFRAEDKSRITETTITNNNNQWYRTNGGNATKDRIFLLSLEEVVKYFGDSGELAKRDTLLKGGYFDDEYNSARMAEGEMDEFLCCWLLRSPGDFNDCAAFVTGDGRVNIQVDSSSFVGGGVRPALWLNL